VHSLNLQVDNTDAVDDGSGMVIMVAGEIFVIEDNNIDVDQPGSPTTATTANTVDPATWMIDYRCGFCHAMMTDPVRINNSYRDTKTDTIVESCDHAFCRNCLGAEYGASRHWCPTCKRDPKNLCKTDHKMRAVLDNLRVQCSRRRGTTTCGWSGKRKLLAQHRETDCNDCKSHLPPSPSKPELCKLDLLPRQQPSLELPKSGHSTSTSSPSSPAVSSPLSTPPLSSASSLLLTSSSSVSATGDKDVKDRKKRKQPEPQQPLQQPDEAESSAKKNKVSAE
jgi:hypothetical protein